jgi:ribosomal protein L40E
MDKVSRVVLASALIVGVMAGTAMLSNMSWASTRVAIEESSVTVPPWDWENYRTWTSTLLPLKKGESVTIEFEATTVPTISLWGEGITLTISRAVVVSGPLVDNRSLVYSSIFCNALYNGSRLFAPKECIVPETANDYQVIVTNYYRYDMKVSFKLTVRSTIIVGGPGTEGPDAPYYKAQILMILWLLLSVGMLVGAACALLVRPKQIVQPVPSPSVPPPAPQVSAGEPPLQMKFCRHCGAKTPRDSKFCEECGKPLTDA